MKHAPKTISFYVNLSAVLISILECINGLKYHFSNFMYDELNSESLKQARRREARERREKMRALQSIDSPINIRDLINRDKDTSKDWASSSLHISENLKKFHAKRSIVVAVIDTGISANHSLIKENLFQNLGEVGLDENGKDKRSNNIDDDGNGFIDDYSGWDFTSQTNNTDDQNGHGTHIAGIVLGGKAATSLNSFIKILPIKFYDPNATSEQNIQNTANAIKYAISQGADIINYSAGGRSQSVAEKESLSLAEEQGIPVIVAAGNEGQNIDRIPYYPASYRLGNIISVGSIDEKNSVLISSNYGKGGVDIVAPGKEISSSYLNNSYKKMTGTSQATAFVSHAIALMMARKSIKSSVLDIKTQLITNGDRDKSLLPTTKYGARLNITKLITN